MPRPIDANALIQDFDRRGWDGVQTVVDMMPTLDVAPVVRCKDCKHWDEPYCMLCKTRIGTSYHSKDMAYRKPDDFCSYGEKRCR